jgi:PLP dependent protein
MVLDSRQPVLANLALVREGIARASERAGRDPGSVRLVAVTKSVPVQAIEWVLEDGVTDIGENYVRELKGKREAIGGAQWHFIGTLQSHTAHRVADLADVVQTLSPGSAVARLSRRASEQGRKIPSLIEVDFTGGRTGVAPDACPAFADEVASHDGLELVGLMTLPPLPETPEGSRPYFVRLRELLASLAHRHFGAVELSMGMSIDYGVAVEEGATMVRIGTAIFGERSPVSP